MNGPETLQRADVERQVVHLVRDGLLGGTDRPIRLDVPLGQTGVGLDSLGILQFIIAVETEFGIAVPDDFLTSHGSVTVAEIVDLVIASAPAPEPAKPPASPDLKTPPRHHRMERLHQRLEVYGPAGRLLWRAARLARPAVKWTFASSRHVILERALQTSELVSGEPPAGVTLREGIPTGADVSGLWPDYLEAESRSSVEQWLQDGAWALAAVEGERVVALDIISITGSEEVALSAGRRACWGHSLFEAPAVRGRGIGLALLAYSLRSASERGFRSQLAMVRDDNRPMLAACTQLLGFQTVGTARRRRVLGVTRWNWEVGGRPGRGPRLTL
jgi:acyl carrier protein/GNAT superfamily N-acetyltransferase